LSGPPDEDPLVPESEELLLVAGGLEAQDEAGEEEDLEENLSLHRDSIIVLVLIVTVFKR
jgi:hypothetical protein